MLEAIIEQVELWSEFRLGEYASRVTILSERYGDFKSTGNQQWLVAKLHGRSTRIDPEDPACLAAVTTRQDVELYPTRFQQLAQKDHKRSVAGASDGEVADANNRAPKRACGQNTTVVEEVARTDYRSIDCGDGVHDGATLATACSRAGGSKTSRAAKVLAVAPACSRRVSAARWPIALRSPPLEINSIKTSGSSAGPTIRTALWVWNSQMMSRKFSV